MAELNAIPLRYEINLPSVKQQSQELKALLQKQSEEHSALLKKQWEAERQHGANVGALKASGLKQLSDLDKKHDAEKKELLQKQFNDEKTHADKVSSYIQGVRVRSTQLAEKENEKLTTSHQKELDKRAKAEEDHALKVMKFHNMLVKNSLAQGDNQRGFREMIDAAFKKSGGDVLHGAGLALGAGGVAGAVGMGLKESIDLAEKYQTALVHLSNTTGVHGASLDALGEKLKKTSLAYNTELPDAITATENILRSLGDEFKNDASATDSATQSVLTLAKAQGLTAEESATALTGVLHEFGLAVGSASGQSADLARIMNVLAAVSKQTNSPMLEITEGMKSAGTMAHSLGLSVEDTATAMALLTRENIKGAEAGGKFSLLMTKMSAGTPAMQKALARLGLTYNDINPEKVGLVKGFQALHDKLNGVGNPINRMEILTEIFGQGARGALKIYEALDKNLPKWEETKNAITGTTTATDQSNKAMETTAEKFSHAKIEAELLGISLGQKLEPAMVALLQTGNDLIDNFKRLFSPDTYKQEGVANLIEKTRKQATDLAISMSKGKYFNKDVAKKEVIDFSANALSNNNPLSLSMGQMAQIVTESNKIVDSAAADTQLKAILDKKNKDNNFGAPSGKKSKEDILQEEFNTQISINELNYKSQLHDQEQFFINKQINFDQWKKNDEANQYQKLYADLSADKEYWRKLGVVTEEGLAQERKYDGDYIDIIAKLDKLKDIERTAELDREKKFNDELHKGSEQRVNDQINMREKLRDAARKLDEEAWKEKEREAAGYKKAIDEKLSETEKSEKEITGVFETEIRKQTSVWEDSIFGKKENFATNIAKGLLEVGENRLFDAVSKAFDSKDTGEKEKIPALQKPVLYKEMKTEMLTVDSLRVGSIDNSAFSGNTFDINQNKLNNGKKFDKDYNTVLNSEEEKAFQKWKSKYAPNDSGSDYDLRGAFEEGMTPDKKNGHWSDKYKKPNHPTFSNESQYAPFGTPGHWDGEKFIPYSQDQLKIGMGTGTKDNQSSNSMSQRELNAIVGGAHPWEQLSEGTTATEAQQKENKRIRDKEALDNFIASHNSDNGSIDEARIPGSISKSLDLDYTKQNKDFFKQVGMQSIDMMKVGMYSSMALGGLANLGGSAALDAAPSWLHSMQHLVAHGVQHAGVDFLGDTIENSGKATDQSKATEGWEGGDIPRLDLGAYQDKNTTTPDKSKATASPEQSDTAIAVKAGVKNGITELGSKAAGGGKINAADILGSLLGIGMSVASGGITKLLGLSMGGIVPQYFADGGSVSSNRSGIITFQGSPGAHKVFKPKGTDTVPSMLTPGEEVLTANDPRHRNNYMRYGSSGVSSTDMSAMHGALKESNALLKEIASQRLVTDNYGNRTGQFQNLQERMGGRF